MLTFLQRLWNDDGGWIQFALPIISALAGGIGGRKGANTGSNNQNFNETQSTSLDPNAIPLRDALLQQHTQSINEPINIGVDDAALERIRLGQIQKVNQTHQGSQEAIASALAARGLSYAPGAASSAITGGEISRAGQVAGINQDIDMQKVNLQLAIPEIMESIRRSRLGGAGQFLQSLPTSSTTSGTRAGTYTQPNQGAVGGAAMGGLEAIAQALARKQTMAEMGNV